MSDTEFVKQFERVLLTLNQQVTGSIPVRLTTYGIISCSLFTALCVNINFCNFCFLSSRISVILNILDIRHLANYDKYTNSRMRCHLQHEALKQYK